MSSMNRRTAKAFACHHNYPPAPTCADARLRVGMDLYRPVLPTPTYSDHGARQKHSADIANTYRFLPNTYLLTAGRGRRWFRNYLPWTCHRACTMRHSANADSAQQISASSLVPRRGLLIHVATALNARRGRRDGTAYALYSRSWRLLWRDAAAPARARTIKAFY